MTNNSWIFPARKEKKKASQKLKTSHVEHIDHVTSAGGSLQEVNRMSVWACSLGSTSLFWFYYTGPDTPHCWPWDFIARYWALKHQIWKVIRSETIRSLLTKYREKLTESFQLFLNKFHWCCTFVYDSTRSFSKGMDFKCFFFFLCNIYAITI